MRYLKSLGLAAVTMLVLVGCIGSGTASATTICTATDTPDCESAHIYKTGTTFHVTLKPGTSIKLTSGGSTIATCTESTMHGTSENEAGTYISIGNTTGAAGLNWGGCSQTQHTINSGTIDFDWIAGTHNATVIGTNAEWTTSIFGVSCTYGYRGSAEGGTHLGTLTGGTKPSLNIATTVVKKAGGFLCPGTAGFDAEYTFTEPHALFFTT